MLINIGLYFLQGCHKSGKPGKVREFEHGNQEKSGNLYLSQGKFEIDNSVFKI